jgi:hypothetical protein
MSARTTGRRPLNPNDDVVQLAERLLPEVDGHPRLAELVLGVLESALADGSSEGLASAASMSPQETFEALDEAFGSTKGKPHESTSLKLEGDSFSAESLEMIYRNAKASSSSSADVVRSPTFAEATAALVVVKRICTAISTRTHCALDDDSLFQNSASPLHGVAVNPLDQAANGLPALGGQLMQDLVQLFVHDFANFSKLDDLVLEVRNGSIRLVHGSVPGSSGVDQVPFGGETPDGATFSSSEIEGGK